MCDFLFLNLICALCLCEKAMTTSLKHRISIAHLFIPEKLLPWEINVIFIEYVMKGATFGKYVSLVLYKIHLVCRITFKIYWLGMLITMLMLSPLQLVI